MLKTTTILLLLLLFINISRQEQTSATGMFGNIAKGIRLAGKLLGLDKSTGVAELVSETFGKTDKKGDDGDGGQQNIFSGFLRILGFDAKRVGAIAVNAIIFVAQLVRKLLISFCWCIIYFVLDKYFFCTKNSIAT